MTVQDGGPPNGTYRRYLWDTYVSRLWRGYWGRRMLETIGLLWDEVAQIAIDAFRAPLHRNTDGPAYDGIRYVGNESSMPQYPDETWLEYRSRLRGDWTTWSLAGDENTIVNQLALAGRPNAQVLRWAENGSWSEFVVFYPNGAHPVTGELVVGSFTVGPSAIIGAIGITPEQLASYKDLIKHWKPADWRCPWIIWEVSGETYGTGHTYGEAGLVYGGTQVRSLVQ